MRELRTAGIASCLVLIILSVGCSEYFSPVGPELGGSLSKSLPAQLTSTYDYLFQFGVPGSGDGQLNNPHGLVIDGNGNVYVADCGNDRIQKFSADGTFLLQWGGSGSGDGQMKLPFGIGLDGSGNILLADLMNHRIQTFAGDGTFLAKWGSMGSGDGQLNVPYDVAVDAIGHIYVSELGNDRIQKFGPDGAFLAKWGGYGSGDGQFKDPHDIAVDGSGSIYVVDKKNHRVQKFSSDGTFITKWGRFGTADGEFVYPIGIAVDGSGHIYVTDGNNQRVQKFLGDGTFLTKWGSAGSGDGEFENPSGIFVNGNGSVFVADAILHRIQVFGSEIHVQIDIIPYKDPNIIFMNNPNRIIPVAILTTDEFDALTVNPETVRFAGASEMHFQKLKRLNHHKRDLDQDGDDDLLFRFRLRDTNLSLESTEGTLIGETLDGMAFTGSDDIEVKYFEIDTKKWKKKFKWGKD